MSGSSRRLATADALGLSAAFAVAWLLFDAPLPFEDATWEPWLLVVGGVSAWTVAARAAGHHRDPGPRPPLRELARVSSLMTLGAWAVVAAAWVTGEHDPDVRQLLAFWTLATAAVVLGRHVARIGGSPAPPAHGRRRARLACPPGPLAAADCVVLLIVLAAGRRYVQEPLPADSTAWAWAFLALAVPAWAASAGALGQYRPGRPSLPRDVGGPALLASWGAWALVAVSPYTGEIDPDVGQLLAVWLLVVTTVPAARLLVRAWVARESRARAQRRKRAG